MKGDAITIRWSNNETNKNENDGKEGTVNKTGSFRPPKNVFWTSSQVNF